MKSRSTWILSLTASASRYETGFTGGFSGTGFGVTNTIDDYTGRLGAEWYASEDMTVRAGLDATHFRFGYVQEFTPPDDSAAQQVPGHPPPRRSQDSHG